MPTVFPGDSPSCHRWRQSSLDAIEPGDKLIGTAGRSMALYIGLWSAVHCVEHHKAVLGSTILGKQDKRTLKLRSLARNRISQLQIISEINCESPLPSNPRLRTPSFLPQTQGSTGFLPVTRPHSRLPQSPSLQVVPR